MSNLSTPQSWNVSGDDLVAAGLTKSYELGQLEMAMQDTLNPVSTGIIRLKVDFAGKGTDTLRIPYVDDVGFSRRFSSLASETSTITGSATTQGYSSITLGMYGLGHGTTQRQRLLAQPNTTLHLQQLISMVPMSALATLRYLACVAGATISTNIGSATQYMSEDDIYALTAAIISTSGSEDRGNPLVTLHSEQLNQLRTSLRSSPAFVQNLQAYLQAAGANTDAVLRNFMGLGFDVQRTPDVVIDTGVYQGFAVAPGGIGYAVASTSSLATDIPAAAEPQFLDEYGLVINRTLSGLGAATNGYEARMYVGVALGTADVFLQRGMISKQ